MFKLVSTRRISWPVFVKVPADGGTVEKVEITAAFEIIETTKCDALLKEADGSKALLRVVLKGWDGISDESGNAIAFGADTLEQVLDVPFVRVAVLNAYFEAASGTAAEKN
ncbi:MAG: hypothetical protein PHY45_11680 [Rhodocyclaceae bacterium]|nr:hypothetical protein [Rhodocyclaceae bacterium]